MCLEYFVHWLHCIVLIVAIQCVKWGRQEALLP